MAIAFGITQPGETIQKQLAEVTLNPEAAFVEPTAGKWTNPRLGARGIILTAPPFAGFAFWPQQNEGKTMLLFETAQQKYWFERTPATAR